MIVCPNYNAVLLFAAPTSNFLQNKALLVISEISTSCCQRIENPGCPRKNGYMFPGLTERSSELDVTKDNLFSTIQDIVARHLDLINEEVHVLFSKRNERHGTYRVIAKSF